ncbi:MAG TPA: heme o synthase [Planctomycetota bacterium]|nr:heme o synthase [Planctomycetota bacterium]
MSTLCLERSPSRLARPSRLQDYLTLARPRIAVLVLATVAVGAAVAAGGMPPLGVLVHALVGTLLVAASSSALNQVLESDTDALMARTASRPLVQKRLSVGEVISVSTVAALVGVAELAWFASIAAAVTALTSFVLYVFAYTPLKRRTSMNTLVGAIPGALPPVIGWTAVTGRLDAGACALFAIVFVWQFPHFLAIAWLNRDDYAKAGLRMLPAVEGGMRITGWQMTNYCLALVPVSLAPALLQLAGRTYFLGALYLGVAFLAIAVLFTIHESQKNARRLLVASLVYLPALLVLLCLDRP